VQTSAHSAKSAMRGLSAILIVARSRRPDTTPSSSAPSGIAYVDVDNATMLCDPTMNLQLGAFEHRLGHDGLDGDLQSIRVDARLRLVEILVTQPLTNPLAADAMGLAVPVDRDVRESVAVRGGGMKESGSASKPDQHVGLFLALLARAIFLL